MELGNDSKKIVNLFDTCNGMKYLKEIYNLNEEQVSNLEDILFEYNPPLLSDEEIENCIYTFGQFAWVDTGTMDSLMEASLFVQTVQNRHGTVISAPEEIAFLEHWINKEELLESARMYGKSPYGEHLKVVAEERFSY